MSDSDVLFVIVDALRPDAVGHLDSPGQPTPTIDHLAERGVSFPDAYSCINTTDPSVTCIHSGCFPATTGLVHHGQQVTRSEVAGLEGITLMQEVLSEAGYETGAVDWLGRWHRRGFDHYTGQDGMHNYSEEADSPGMLKTVADVINANQRFVPDPLYDALKQIYRTYVNPLGGKGAVEDAETTTDLAIELLDRMSSPSYLFVHYWDVHAPYDTPDHYAENAVVPDFDYEESAINEAVTAIQNEDRRRYIEEILVDGIEAALAEYYGAAAYVDDQLARLLKYVPDDAYIVVMADHGESLFEHGIFFEHHGLYDVNTRVPLVVAGPDVPAEIPRGFVQLCDVRPTVLGRLSLDSESTDGIDAFARAEAGDPLRDAVFLEEAHTQRKRAVRTDRWTYLRTLDDGQCSYCLTAHSDPEVLYDRDTDPGETENVVADHPGAADELRERLDAFFENRGGVSEADRIRTAMADIVDSTAL